jgi:Ca2+-binding RTX toxin-like protein
VGFGSIASVDGDLCDGGDRTAGRFFTVAEESTASDAIDSRWMQEKHRSIRSGSVHRAGLHWTTTRVAPRGAGMRIAVRRVARGLVLLLLVAGLSHANSVPAQALQGEPVGVAELPGGSCRGMSATVVGTSGSDVLVGTRHRDIIRARAGNDRVLGMAGNDVICGGGGLDTLAGGPGDDHLLGMGDERDEEDSGVAFFRGDSLSGGRGSDRLVGGDAKGGDTVSFAGWGRSVAVRLGVGRAHGQGIDRLIGVEQVVGSAESDLLLGWRDSVTAPTRTTCRGTDRDVEYPCPLLQGGAGDDEIRSDGALFGGFGVDTLRVGGSGYVNARDGDDDVAYVGEGGDPRVHAGKGDDKIVLTGTASNTVYTGSGDDTVQGGQGDDVIHDDRGPDTIRTLAGDDYFSYLAQGDRLWMGHGSDRLVVALVGSNDSPSQAYAGPGDDWAWYYFWPIAVADTMVAGGSGRDTLNFEYLGLDEHPGPGMTVDLTSGTAIRDGKAYTVPEFEDVIGSLKGDQIYGNLDDNKFSGGPGDDVLVGNGGSDTADGDAGFDRCDAEIRINCEE